MASQVFVFITILPFIYGSVLGQSFVRSPKIHGFVTGQPKIYSPWSAIDQPSTVSSSSSAATIPDCNSVISELNPCVGYMSKNQAKPSDTCCAGVKSLRQYNNNKAARQAICHCLESVAPMFGNIDYSLLAGLPKKCGVSVKLPADISPNFDCSKA